MTFRENKESCVEIDFCEDFPNASECLDKQTFCDMNRDNKYSFDYCKSNEDKCQNQLVGNSCK
jgi:hypothetical protein